MGTEDTLSLLEADEDPNASVSGMHLGRLLIPSASHHWAILYESPASKSTRDGGDLEGMRGSVLFGIL